MKYTRAQKNRLQEKIPQKIPFNKALGQAVKGKAQEMTRSRAQKIGELRHFTWMLKRVGFKNASNLGAGVDVVFKTVIRGKEVKITADQKVANGGRHGDNAIEIRVKNRELYNKADWVIILNKQKMIEAFPSEALARFVKQQSGSLRFYERRKKYDVYSVNLDKLYKFMEQIMQTEPIRVGLSREAGKLIINEMIKRERAKLPPLAKPKQSPVYKGPVKKTTNRLNRTRTPVVPARKNQRIVFDRKVNPGIRQK